MASNMMNWFRVSKRLPSLALLLAFFAPVILGVLPTPSLSAEQQLLADLSSNICSQNINHQQSGDKNIPPDQHGQCCVLCATQAHALAVSDTPAVVVAERERLQQLQQASAAHFIPRGAPPLDSASPRGPPNVFSA
jgi:Protein of unknown function (DUF2946)